MNKKNLSRRNFVKVSATTLVSSVAANALAAATPTAGSSSEVSVVECSPITYTNYEVNMDIQDIGEIGIASAALLALRVTQAQCEFAAAEILNEVRALSSIEIDGINLYEKALKSATIAYNEAPADTKDQWAIAAFCLNIGNVMAPENPISFSAAALRPYLDDSVYQVIKAYPILSDTTQRSRISRESWYQDGIRFYEWQQRVVAEGFVQREFNFFGDKLIAMLYMSTPFNAPANDKIIPESEFLD